MSAIASFIKLPKTALAGLRDVAVPKRRIFGGPRDDYPNYLRNHGLPTARYEWAGSILGTLLPYLGGQQIVLMSSEHDELAEYLTKSRQATRFILTDSHRQAFLERLKPESFSKQELGDYYNEFNETHEPEAGGPMLDGIRALHTSLSAVDKDSVILLSIG